MHCKHLTLLALLCSVLVGTANAQYPLIFLETGGGMNAYKGELNRDPEKLSAGMHLNVRFNPLDRRTTMRAGVFYGHCVGQQVDFVYKTDVGGVPATFFRTRLIHAHADFLLNLVNKEYFKVYLGQGIGLLNFKPMDAKGNNLRLMPGTRANTEPEYSPYTATLPSFIGAFYVFKNGFALGTEIGMMNPMTDYIDNLQDLAPDRQTQFGFILEGDNVLTWHFSLLVPIKFLEKPIRYRK